MGASLYKPINVYKPVAPNLGIVECLTVVGVTLPLPFTTRMTVARLSNGDLFLHSPIKFDATLGEQLQTLGEVRHLVSPDQFHYAHIGEWSKAFPEAITWASPRVRQRAHARNIEIEFARDLRDTPPEEWRHEIDQTLFPGGYFKEFIFFHRASRSLILTENWRALANGHEAYWDVPSAWLPLLLQRRKRKVAIGRIRSWQPQRIILSHGRCFDADAGEVIERIFP
jgi:Domain of unknown function (DUF4336)